MPEKRIRQAYRSSNRAFRNVWSLPCRKMPNGCLECQASGVECKPDPKTQRQTLSGCQIKIRLPGDTRTYQLLPESTEQLPNDSDAQISEPLDSVRYR